MPHKSEWPAKTPVIPSWCDWNQCSVSNKIIFIGVTRAIFALTGLCVCSSLLAFYDLAVVTQVLLILLMILNVFQLFSITFFTIHARSGDPVAIKRWLISDIVLMAIFATAMFVLLVSADVRMWHLFVGIKFILVAVWLSYRNWRYYLALTRSVPVVVLE